MEQLLERRGSRRRRRPPVLRLLLCALAVGGGLVLAARLLGGGPACQAPPENPDWITQDFLPRNDYSRPGTPLDAVDGVVVHYVGNPGTTAGQNRSYFAGLARSGETYASSHFLIGLDGEILQCVPLDEVAYCSNQRNHDTLSIECCHPDETGKFTDETYDSLVRLTAWLCTELDLTEKNVIRHYDVTEKRCPLYFVDHEDAWEDFLADVKKARKDMRK